MRETMTKILPVIMCGGSGSRMWPESRESLPKQFLPLIGERSTFQSIVGLVGDPAVFDPSIVITNFDYRFRVAEQLREMGAEATILLEPERRDSAAAVGAAAAWAAARDPKTVVAVLAADHVFDDGKQFARLCVQARDVAAAGEIVTFGITPNHPATGYGYIHPAEPLAIDPSVRRIEQFVEKPDERHARVFINDGYLWNGEFRLPRRCHARRARPLRAGDRRRGQERGCGGEKGPRFRRPRPCFLRKAPKTSIDYAVMERTDKAAVLTADVGWSDVGEWSAVWRLSPRDARGNSFRGRAVTINSENVLVRSEEQLAAVIGLRDVVVIATRDAVLVADPVTDGQSQGAGRAAQGRGPTRSDPACADVPAMGLLSERRPGLALPGQAHCRQARQAC